MAVGVVSCLGKEIGRALKPNLLPPWANRPAEQGLEEVRPLWLPVRPVRPVVFRFLHLKYPHDVCGTRRVGIGGARVQNVTKSVGTNEN